jgi:uncharacterized membrane protein
MASFAETLSTFREFMLHRFPWRFFLILILFALVSIWMYFAPDGILGKADAIGYAVCHRIDHRSFHIGENQFSVCARCTGQYLGAVLGMVFLGVSRRRRVGRPPWFIIGILLIWGMAYAVDGFNSFLHLIPGTDRFWLYEPSNAIRLTTGMGVGIGISVLLFPAFNQTVWKRYDRRPVLEGLRDFGLLLSFVFFLVLIVLTENPIILYPLSLVSAGGVLMLLTVVYSMVWVMLFRSEGNFENLWGYFYPLMAGLSVALIQILAIDLFRYVLTGTWGEFPLV